MIKISEGMRSKKIVTAALAYAQAGWRVHPLKRNSKEPLLKNWPDKASSDPEVIKRWFKNNPDSNLGGIPPDNVFVIDIDGADGKESYKSLGFEALTAKVMTPRGSHRYYSGSISKSKIGILKGLDLIGGDGTRYLVLPPSQIKGVMYQWNKRDHISALKMDYLKTIERHLSSSKNIMSGSGQVSEGSRNDAIFKIACTLRRRGIDDDLVRNVLIKINKAICETPLPESEILNIVQSSARYDHGHEEAFADMAEVKQANVDWFWYPYMARGCMTIIEGAPGQGKSYLTMYLAALTSSGGRLPFSKEKMKAGRVLILNAEDDAASILRPRLEKCGAKFLKDNIRFQKKFVPMDAQGVEILETEISSYRPDLVIIDPLLTYMLGDMHRYNEATTFMAEIDQLARQYSCCIIGIRHLTKSNNDDASKRGIGSVGFAARARSVIQVGKAPDDDEDKAVGHVKTNLGIYGKTLVFSLKGGGRDEVPEFIWKREADYPADALNRPREVGRPSEQMNIQHFLRQQLMAGSMKMSDLMVMAQSSGIVCSTRTLQRALEDVARPEGKGPKAKWVLKE